MSQIGEAARDIVASIDALAEDESAAVLAASECMKAALRGGFGDAARGYARYGHALFRRTSPEYVLGRAAPTRHVTIARQRLVRLGRGAAGNGHSSRRLWADLRGVYRASFILAEAAPRAFSEDPWTNDAGVQTVRDVLGDLGYEPEDDPRSARLRELIPRGERARDPRAWLGSVTRCGGEMPPAVTLPGDLRARVLGGLGVLESAAGGVLAAVEALACDPEADVPERLAELSASVEALLVLTRSEFRGDLLDWWVPLLEDEDPSIGSPWVAWTERCVAPKHFARTERAVVPILALVNEKAARRLTARGLYTDLFDLHEIGARVLEAEEAIDSGDLWKRSAALMWLWNICSLDLVEHRRSMLAYIDVVIDAARTAQTTARQR